MEYTEVYNEEDFTAAKNFKRRCLLLIAVVTAAFLVGNLLIYLDYLRRPYGVDKAGYILLHGATVLVFVLFLVIYGIRYRRVKNYNKTLYFLKRGTMEQGEGVFLEFTERDELKDGVEYTGVSLSVHNSFRNEEFERRFFYDKAKPLPDFKKGDRIAYVSLGALIVKYRNLGQEDEK